MQEYVYTLLYVCVHECLRPVRFVILRIMQVVISGQHMCFLFVVHIFIVLC